MIGEPRKLINYFWAGNPLPTEFLINLFIGIEISQRSGFDIHLWTDDINCIEKAIDNFTMGEETNKLASLDLMVPKKIPKLRIRHIDELYEEMEKYPVFCENNYQLIKAIQKIVALERIGLKSLAAVSDIYRYGRVLALIANLYQLFRSLSVIRLVF